jgi:hypothetical protein
LSLRCNRPETSLRQSTCLYGVRTGCTPRHCIGSSHSRAGSDKSVKPQRRCGKAMRGLRSRRVHATEKSRAVDRRDRTRQADRARLTVNRRAYATRRARCPMRVSGPDLRRAVESHRYRYGCPRRRQALERDSRVCDRSDLGRISGRDSCVPDVWTAPDLPFASCPKRPRASVQRV